MKEQGNEGRKETRMERKQERGKEMVMQAADTNTEARQDREVKKGPTKERRIQAEGDALS